MHTTPEQTMGLVYKFVLWIIIGLLIAAGVFSWFSGQPDGGTEAKILVRVYLLVIPAALMLFTVIMAVRRIVPLAVSGGILSVLWLVFSWIG